MTIHCRMLLTVSLAALCCAAGATPPGQPAEKAPPSANVPDVPPVPRVSADEARRQAELLHETIHATLQIVHHQYYREDEGLRLPAAVLKDVFAELARSRQVQLRWLAVTAQPVNIDHRPADEFEKNAVEALAAGKEHFELAADGLYRRAARINLRSECLKCHLPSRTSTADRAAGLVISIPIARIPQARTHAADGSLGQADETEK